MAVLVLLSCFGALKSTAEYSFYIHTFRQPYNWGRYSARVHDYLPLWSHFPWK